MKRKTLAILAGVATVVALTAADCDGTSGSASFGCSLVRSQSANPGSYFVPWPVNTWYLQPSGISVKVLSRESCVPVDGGGN